MSRPLVSLIAVVDRQRGIGKDNRLLVHLPEDLRHFKRTTLGCPVVMARKTWESIGKPRPGRPNLVLPRDAAWCADGADAVPSLAAALALAGDAPKVFVIGGAEVFAQALPLADELVLTELDASFDADAFFPAWSPADFTETARETLHSDQGFDYHFVRYRAAAPV